jgi:exoribonuclease R
MTQKMQISGVLQLTNRTLYGMTARKIPMYLFTPLNRSLPDMAVASTTKNKTKNLLVLVDPLRPAEGTGGSIPRGAVRSVFGECGDMEAERKAIHYAYSPIRWNTFPAIVEPTETVHESLEDVPTINIDPLGCRDIDDCISIWDSPDGTTKVAITIADVAEWVRFNPWMLYAARIGQTLYDSDGKIIHSMFPHEHRMSLTPKSRRLCIALTFDWNEGTGLSNVHFKQVSIVNKASYTYENVHDATDFPVKTLRSICESIASKSLPDAHDWVETLMTTYNLTLAQHLYKEVGAGLLRAHDAPKVLKNLNYEALGLPDHLIMSSARYEPVSSGAVHHLFGNVYCHATSPIRRWADVVNQMAFKKMEIEYCYADSCNVLQSYSKKHARDLQFIDILVSGEENKNVNVKGVVVSETRIWIPVWERLITCTNTLSVGTNVSVDYHLDMSKPTWKQRVVFRATEDV